MRHISGLDLNISFLLIQTILNPQLIVLLKGIRGLAWIKFLTQSLQINGLRMTFLELLSSSGNLFLSQSTHPIHFLFQCAICAGYLNFVFWGWIHQAVPICIRLIRFWYRIKDHRWARPLGSLLTGINGKMCSVRGFHSLQFSLLYDIRISSDWGLFYRKHFPDRMCCYHFLRLSPLESTSILSNLLSIAMIYRNNKSFVDVCIIANNLIFVHIIS